MCRLCNPISRFSRPLPLRQQNNQYGDRTNAGGNTIIIAGDNYAPINGGGNVNNGAIGCNNNNNNLGGGRQMFAFMAKMMQFFMTMFAMMGLQNQLAGNSCGCGCGCNAGLDFIG